MTDDEINRAIAKVCGWTDFSEHPDWGTMAIEPGTHGLRTMIPSYSTDLNWMHEAEKTIYNKHNNLWTAYYYAVGAGPFSLHVTARRKAEAFLRALGKWEEVQK